MIGRILAIAIWLCMFGFICFAQQATTDRNKLSLAPASPEASMLFKFTDIPVSKYTGVPNITIPIRKVGTPGINLDLSLQYHASGIRPADVASYVGLGWMLNAGGMISRKPKGLPDDDASEGFLTVRQHYTYTQLNEPNELLYDQLSKGCIDAEPDEFYFNVNGYSGKFAFDWSVANNIVVSSEHPVTVKYFQEIPNSKTITKWQLQTPDGNLYTFSQSESSYNEDHVTGLGICKPSGAYISSWYVTRIENVNTSGEYAEFTYDMYAFTDDWLHVETKDFGTSVQCGCPAVDGTPSRFSSNQLQTSSARPKQITFYPGNIKVDFIANTVRTDVPQGALAEYKNKSLDFIRISFDGKQVEEYKFEYDHGSRLLLKRIQKMAAGVAEPPLEFSYYAGNPGPRDTKSIDEWGYYNGAANSTLLPSFVNTTLIGSYLFTGADRRANAINGQVLSLKKITYPTGGNAEFIYEGHDYAFINERTVSSYWEYEKVSRSKNVHVVGDNIDVGGFKTKTEYFTLDIPTEVEFNYLATTHSCTDGGDLGGTFCYGGIYMPGALVERLEPLGPNKVVSGYNHPTLSTGETVYKNEKIFLEAGEYKITVNTAKSPNNPDGFHDQMGVTVKYFEKGPLIISNTAGGLRIREIRHSDNLTSVVKSVRYEYKLDETGLSSGVLNGKSVYYDETDLYTRSTCSTDVYINCFYYTLTGSNRMILGQSGGSHIGYKKVSTIETGNGRTVSEFLTSSDAPDIVNTGKPWGSPTSNGHRQGLPKTEAVFDEAGNPVKRDMYEYDFSAVDVNSLKVSLKTYCSYSIQNAPVNDCPSTFPIFNRFARWNSPLRMGYSKIKKLTSVERGLETIKEFTYDGKLQLLKQETFYNAVMPSDKDIVTYRHTEDAGLISGLSAGQLAAINLLKQQNRMSVILEAVKKRNNGVVNQTRHNYKVWPDGQVALEEMQEAIGSAPLEQRLKIEQFDATGQVVQQRKANDHPYVYLRDHHSAYISAQVLNASFNDVAYTSFEADGTGNWIVSNPITYGGGSLTGERYYDLVAGQISKNNVTPGKQYVLSYWSRHGAYTISGAAGSVKQGYTTQSWTYYEHLITPSATSISISGIGLIDELRFFPIGAMMSTFTYMPMVGVTSQCSPSNMIMYYEYDALNRLSLVRDIDRNIQKKFAYEYQVTGHSVANWQNTGLTRCKPCPDNPGHATNILQRERKDINPTSPTYNRLEWYDDGVSSSCQIVPFWEVVSGEYCEQKTGRNTGNIVHKEMDTNPCSPTYRQTKEVYKRFSLSECPVLPVYARLRIVNPTAERSDILIDFFLDPEATTPFVVDPSKTVTIEKVTYNVLGGSSRSYLTGQVQGSSTVLLLNAWLREPGVIGTKIHTYTVLPSYWFHVIN